MKFALPLTISITSLLLLAGCNHSDEPIDPPMLLEFSVSGTEEAMYPEFAPETRHYAVRCKSSDTLSIDALSLLPTDNISIDGNTTQSGSDNLTIVGPSADQDIKIEVSRGTLIEEYTLHCLAEDFPDIEIVRNEISDPSDLMLMSPKFRKDGERKSYLLILDNNGVPRFRRKIDNNADDFKRHSNGNYSYALLEGLNEFGVNGYVIVILDENFNEINRVKTIGLTNTDNHDFEYTDEGNFIILSYHSTIRDMSAFGLSAEEVVGDSVIQEISPAGEVVFQWNSWDHMDLSDCQDSGFPRFPSDYAHINSVELTSEGDMIASFRGCAQVLKIDRPTGDVIWQLGGTMSDFMIIDDPYDEFCGQHTALELSEDRILMFDNGSYCLGPREDMHGRFSRILEYRLDLQAGQAHFVMDHSLNNSYTEFTSSQGSVQQLSNGNRFISWGRGPEMSVSEINMAGEEIFAMKITFEDSIAVSYRAFREASLPQD